MKKDKKNINISCSANAPIYKRVKCASLIVEQYNDFLRAIILFNVKKAEEVDDIMQDFFISLVEHPIRDDIEDMKSYLYRAITNDIIDARRRTKGFKEHVSSYANYMDSNAKQQINHENIVMETEEIKKIFKKIRSCLPAHEAQALLNYYIFNYDIQTASQRMKIDVRTFSRYICTGLKKFRRFLELTDGKVI